MAGKVKYCEGQHIFIRCGEKVISVFPVYNNRQPYYPIVAGYSFTVHKVMGQTLPHVTLVFDTRFLSPAVGYVALSRVSLLPWQCGTYATAKKDAFYSLLTNIFKISKHGLTIFTNYF